LRFERPRKNRVNLIQTCRLHYTEICISLRK
jgi:hypothetical protein